MGVPREDGRITGLLWADYRPKDNPGSVIIQHPKTHEAVACRSTLATADRYSPSDWTTVFVRER